MISENFRTKSAKMRPAKIKQMVDLQKWFNDCHESRLFTASAPPNTLRRTSRTTHVATHDR